MVLEQVNQLVWRADQLYARAVTIDREANRLLHSIGRPPLRRAL